MLLVNNVLLSSNIPAISFYLFRLKQNNTIGKKNDINFFVLIKLLIMIISFLDFKKIHNKIIDNKKINDGTYIII